MIIILDILNTLSPTDTFNIITFSRGTLIFSEPGSVNASAGNSQDAMDFIDYSTTVLQGASNLLRGLQAGKNYYYYYH